MAGKIYKFIFKYVDPVQYFNTSNFKDAGVSAVICEEGYFSDGTLDDITIITVWDTDYGCEMRTRCWILNGTEETGLNYLTHLLSGMRNMADKLRIYIEESARSHKKTNIICKFCGSREVVRNGLHKNEQYWLCKACGHGFLNNHNLPKMKYPPDTIATSVNNYYSGNSITNICKGIEPRHNVLPSSSTVYAWIKRLTLIALKEEKKYTPKASERWAFSEKEIVLNSQSYRLCYIIDLETRFILAIKLSVSKRAVDLGSFLQAAQAKAQKLPRELYLPGGRSYRDSLKSAFDANSDKILIVTDVQREKESYAELSGVTILERLKPWYGSGEESRTQIILDGFAFHYNFLRLNEKLGSVPARAASINFPFRSWLDILRSQ